jgi:hypothetical protein
MRMCRERGTDERYAQDMTMSRDGESGMGELGECDDFVEFLVSTTDAGAD